MAWTDITYKCGHVERQQLYGPYKQRDYTVESAKERLCRDCYIKQQQKAAEKTSASHSLVALEGSPKQVQWAESIRASFVTSTLTNIPSIHPQLEIVRNALILAVNSMSASKWWIDNRYDLKAKFSPIYKMALKQLGYKE